MKKIHFSGKGTWAVLPLVILVFGASALYGYSEAGTRQIKAQEAENEKAARELETAQAENKKAKEEAAGVQKQLEDISAREEQLRAEAALYSEKEAAADSETFLKQKMISSYLENQEFLIAAQSEVLGSVGVDTGFLVSYTERDVKGEALEMVENAVIDGLVEEIGAGAVGDVAGTTAKEVIHSMAEDFSVDGLCQGISNGLSSGVQNVMQSSIQDKINDMVGFDIFGTADLVDQLAGYETQVPEYLASKISLQIQNDADSLYSYLEQEQLTKTDLENIQVWFADLGALAEELYEQTGGGVDVRPTDWQLHNENLKEIYKGYCINEQIIALCEEELGVEHEKE